jgi:Zn-dependent M28 family amino/carboxypeptidase
MRIVCAHFDSCVENSFDSISRAPGANDNATGIAVMLELARLLKDVSLPYPVVFLATSGEEQNLWGSTNYAAKLRKTDAHVRFLLNLDEVGHPNGAGEVVVEYDRSPPIAANKTSRRIAGEVAALAASLGIPTIMGDIDHSDYMPFQTRGYVTIGLYESGRYAKRHTSEDTCDQVDFDYVAKVTRVALAALLHPFPTAADEGQEI